MIDKKLLRVKVAGEYACFTRPDLKVERMSYPCMTISAARGILDSILWKPEFKWWIKRIQILNPVKFISVKRNELNNKISPQKSFINASRERTQRNSIILKDVAYIIEACVYQNEFDPVNPPNKYSEMFLRRIKKGQCYRRPYLGTREFSCEFTEVTDEDQPIEETYPIGSMFYDIHYGPKGEITPLFTYDAVIKSGVLNADKSLNEKLVTSSHIIPKRSKGVKEILKFYSDMEVAYDW